MASRKSSLTALSFNCGSQEPDNIILVKDNGLPADLTSKGYFGLAFHCRRHGTCLSCKTSCNAITASSISPRSHGEQSDGRRRDFLDGTMRDAIF
jgi:hypothetical protein